MVTGTQTTAIRERFPLLRNKPQLAYLDSAATTQIPDEVLSAVDAFETGCRANIHRGLYPLAEAATDAYEQARQTVASFLGTSAENIAFTSGATAALNLAVQGWGLRNLKAGDMVVIDTANHHSAIVPWQMLAARLGLDLRFVHLNAGGSMNAQHWRRLLERGPKAVCLCHGSNVTGHSIDLAKVARQARDAGAIVFADVAQSVPHQAISLDDSGADFAALSAHKMYGPFGIGALYMGARVADAIEPVWGGGGMISSVTEQGFSVEQGPAAFEAGTPNISGAVGFAAACDFLGALDRERAARASTELCNQVLDVLASNPRIRVLGSTAPGSHASIVSFIHDGIHPHDLADSLGRRHVAVRAGHHCAMPLHQALGVPASVRVSFGAYSTEQDVERFARALHQAEKELL